MIEDAEAIDNIDEIVEVEGIDVLNVGTSDLAAFVGCTGTAFTRKSCQSL